jgi:hypothetical protein
MEEKDHAVSLSISSLTPNCSLERERERERELSGNGLSALRKKVPR